MKDKKQFFLKITGELYMKYGIRAVTMDDVAAEFGISKKTLYQSFKDKEDLVRQVIDYYLENPLFNLNQEGLGNAIDRVFALRNHVSRILNHYNNHLEHDLKKTYPVLYKKVYDYKRQRIYDDTARNITDGIESGLFREDLNPDFIARLQVGRMLYTFNPDNEIFDNQALATIQLFDEVMDYQMHAICTEKGLAYYKKQLKYFQNEERNND
jgi:TetR/AcrR family transcriptional regulator, cholesterol catabolism regulator